MADPGKMLPQLTAGILACQNGSALTRLNRHLVLARHFGILEGLGGMAVVGAAAAYYHHKKLDRLAMPGPKGSRTVERSDGSRVIYTMKDRELMKTVDPNLKALPDLVRKGLKLSQNGDMLGRRNTQKEGAPWEWIQYADAIQKSKDMAYGFRCLNVPIGQKTCIGIFMKNRPEWILTEMACHVFNNVSVPIYDSAHIDHIVHIVNETEMPLIVVSNGKKAKILMSRIKCMPKVRYIVTIDAFDEPYLKHAAEENNIRMLSLEELETLGREMPDKPNVAEPKPEDVATICYTSGTTGLPKGVILTHGNFVSAYSATTLWPEGKNPWQPGGAMISYLPLAHIMEHYFEYGVFLHGGKVGHFRGDVSQLLDDMQTLQPIVVPAVPRILNKICDSVDQELSKSPIKRAIFNLGIAYKKYELSRGVVRNDSLVDKIVFRKIQGLFGGRMKWMLTGSAPVSVEVMTFARCAFGCVVTEGYGQTETCAPSTARKKLAIDMGIPTDHTMGHVGVPIPSLAVKLGPVPALGYDGVAGGEIMVKGNSVTPGYFKRDEITKETFDSSGFLKTGDIGRWNIDGNLVILDRTSNIFKLSQGEFVSPEKIEQIYNRSRYVAQCYVHGNPLKSCIVAVIVVDEEAICKLGQQLNILQSVEHLCEEEAIRRAVIADLAKIGREHGLLGYEIAKEIKLTTTHFTVENGQLTPSLKNRRQAICRDYKEDLDELYKHLR